MLGQLGGEERLPVTLERRNEHYSGGTRMLNVDTTVEESVLAAALEIQ